MKKLIQLIEEEKNNGYDIRREPIDPKNPGFASYRGFIVINEDFITNPRPAFPEDRMIVVLYHEIGHIDEHKAHPMSDSKRNLPNNMAISEEWAFRNSLLKTKEMFEAGDKGPLQLALWRIKERKESREGYAYQIALTKTIESDLWKQCELLASKI